MKIFWGGKTKKTSDDRKYKKTWNWDRQIIFWDNWITSITSITPITLITLITPITSITKKNQGPKLKANHKSHQSHQSHFWSELSHKEPLVGNTYFLCISGKNVLIDAAVSVLWKISFSQEFLYFYWKWLLRRYLNSSEVYRIVPGLDSDR